MSGVQCEAHGGVSQWRFGNGLYESTGYNKRRQLRQRLVGTTGGLSDLWGYWLEYGVANNGNVEAAQVQLRGSRDDDAAVRLRFTRAGYFESAAGGYERDNLRLPVWV